MRGQRRTSFLDVVLRGEVLLVAETKEFVVIFLEEVLDRFLLCGRIFRIKGSFVFILLRLQRKHMGIDEGKG